MIAFRAVVAGRLGFFTLSILVSLSLVPTARAEVPADGWVVWQSIRQDGRFEIYRAKADGTDVTRMTTTGAGKPMWSPDGRWLSYLDPAGAVYLMRPDGSGQHNVAPPSLYGFWLHDNSGLVVNDGAQYFLMDPETEQKTPLFNQADFPQFGGTTFQPNAMTHDNRYLLLGSHLYDFGYTGANGSFKGGFSAVAVDLLHKDKTYYIGNGCWPFSPPQGDLVFHICNDCPQHPDIYRLSMADIATRSSYLPEKAAPDTDWGHEYNPRVSTDNKWVVYMTSTGCHDGVSCDYDIFLHRLGADALERSRVTNEPTFDGYPDMYVGPLWKAPAGPELFTRPSRITGFASATALPPAQMVKIKNGGGGSLGPLKVAIEPLVPWLALSAGPTALTLEIKREGLMAGRNQTTVTISSEGVPGMTTVPIVINADESFPAGPDAGAPADAAAGDVAPGDAATAPDAGVAADGPAATGDGGCDCAVGAQRRPGAGWLLLGLLLMVRRRRRQ
jgi:MYXO-CTERM domain-containing protein